MTCIFVNVQGNGVAKLEPQHICADYLEGLIHIIPLYGAVDDAGKYCIGGLTIDLYSGLLQKR